MQKASAGTLQQQLETLQQQLKDKLGEQRRLSDRLREKLVGSSSAGIGLIENSRLTTKNLQAAIVASKQPGYFQYYESPDSVRKINRDREVHVLQKQIARAERELTQIKVELAKVTKQLKQAREGGEATMNTLEQWFASGTTQYVAGKPISCYGKPERPGVDGWLTEFVPAPKVYGGTKHHNAFKTVSSTMMLGRMMK
eukprot:g3993.t1